MSQSLSSLGVFVEGTGGDRPSPRRWVSGVPKDIVLRVVCQPKNRLDLLCGFLFYYTLTYLLSLMCPETQTVVLSFRRNGGN